MDAITNFPRYSDCNYTYSRAIRIIKSDEQDGAEQIVEPVTLTEAKRWLRISPGETTDDQDILEAITDARQQVEEYLNVSLVRRTITASLQLSPNGMQLPFAPVIDELISVTDADGNVIEDGYKLNQGLFTTDYNSDVVVEYEAGYEKCPAWGKKGIRRMLAFDWENRGDEVVRRNLGQITGLKQYRRVY